MRMGANPSVSYRRLPPTLKAERVGTFRTISGRMYDRGDGYREAAVPVETPHDKSGVRRTGAICPDANKTPVERHFAEASKSLPRTVPTWRQVPFNANIVSLLYHISISLEV